MKKKEKNWIHADIHPRPYISYSQLRMFEQNLEEYKRIYFYGEENRPPNRGQVLGKTLSDAMEEDEETGDIEVDAIMAQITPKLPRRDEIIMTKLSVGKYPKRDFVPILVKPDRCSLDYMTFQEIKTFGKSSPWSQGRVDKDDQMTFYFMGLYLAAKRDGSTMIPKGELIACPTEKRIDDDGIERPHLVGDILRFPTTRTFADILRMEARVARAWREIGEAFEKEII